MQEDFKDNFKYKLFMPLAHLIFWTVTISMQFYDDDWNKCILYAIIAYMYFKNVRIMIGSMISFVRALKALQRHEERKLQEGVVNCENDEHSKLTNQNQSITHAFIIPNYTEEEALLAQSLRQLASHKNAKDYIVLLAMEAHDPNCQHKVEALTEAFQQHFRFIGHTKHIIAQHQQRGKAANYVWCCNRIEQLLQKQNINYDNLMLHLIDADAWVPEMLIAEVDEHLSQNYDRRHTFIYQSGQMFNRNNLEVPFFTRSLDDFAGSLAFAGISSSLKISFPISQFSISYLTAKNIGFNDTCPDAVAEDMHIFNKANWKTHGQIYAVPIYALVSQLNISTGSGYIQDIKAKFWQLERHARNILEMSYHLKMMVEKPFSWRCWLIAVINFDIMLIQIVSLGFIFSSIVTGLVHRHHTPLSEANLATFYFMQFLASLGMIPLVVASLIYELIKRRFNSQVYGQLNPHWWRIFQSPIIYVIGGSLLFFPASMMALFRSLKADAGFRISQKSTKSIHLEK